MPFTVSHVAAVLPAQRLLRRLGLFSAAAIGSMTPDFGILMPIHMSRAATHGLAALLSFCLPAGLATWWLFQLLIRPAWCAVLPGNWRRRLRAEHSGARLLDWRIWVGAAIAILAGALTHLVWDGFTHEGGRGVSMLPWLDEPFGPDLVGHPLRLYRWLQHGSSVIGLIVVTVAAWRWTRGRIDPSLPATIAAAARHAAAPPDLPARERHQWQAAYLVLPLLLLLAAIAAGRLHVRPWTPVGDVVTQVVVLGLIAVGASQLLVSAAVRWRVRQRSLDG